MQTDKALTQLMEDYLEGKLDTSRLRDPARWVWPGHMAVVVAHTMLVNQACPSKCESCNEATERYLTCVL